MLYQYTKLMGSTLPVTCAIIENQGTILCAQRSGLMALPYKWEFPGGKIEKGESAEACLVREIKEELNIEIVILRAFPSHTFDDGFGKVIELMPFLCHYNEADLRVNEHLQITWVKVEDLKKLDWAEADIPIVLDFMAWYRFFKFIE